MLPPSTMVAALTLMMLATPPLTSMVATPMLMLPSCMELMAMLPPSTTVTAITLMMPSTWARGICLCGMALAVNHMWRTKTKTRPRRNVQPVENQQRVSSHKTLD